MLRGVARAASMYGLSGLGIGHFPDAVVNRTEENGVQKSKNVLFSINLKKKRRRAYFDCYRGI